jgi:hypothetical protein
MGFLSNMLSATVKTVLTPVAVVKDAVNVVTGEEADATKNLLSSAVEDVEEGFDDLGEGELL